MGLTRQNSQIKDITVSRKFKRRVPTRGPSGKKTFSRTQFSVMHVSMAKETDAENSIFSTQTASKANLTKRFRTGNLSHRKGAKMAESIHLTGKNERKTSRSGAKFSRINRFKKRAGMHQSEGGLSVGRRRFGNLKSSKQATVIQKNDVSGAKSVFDSIQPRRI